MGKATIEKGEVMYIEIGWGLEAKRIWMWRCPRCGKIITGQTFDELTINAHRHISVHKEKKE